MRCNLIPAMMKLLSAGGAVAATTTTPGVPLCNRDNDRHVISALVRQATRQGLERAGQNDMAVDVFKDSSTIEEDVRVIDTDPFALAFWSIVQDVLIEQREELECAAKQIARDMKNDLVLLAVMTQLRSNTNKNMEGRMVALIAFHCILVDVVVSLVHCDKNVIRRMMSTVENTLHAMMTEMRMNATQNRVQPHRNTGNSHVFLALLGASILGWYYFLY